MNSASRKINFTNSN